MIPSGPAVESVIYCCRWAIFWRTIPPPTAALQNMDDPADDPAIIHPACARLVRWQVRLNRRPCRIVQPKKIRQLILQATHHPHRFTDYPSNQEFDQVQTLGEA